MKLFMDNVPTLAIQAQIVRKLDEVLCPTTVFRMPPELVTKIAGESKEKIQEREEILSRLSTLEAGAQICRQYAMRPQSCEYIFISYELDNETDILAEAAPLNPPFEAQAVPSSSSSGTSLFRKGTPSKGLPSNAAFGAPSGSSSGTSNLFGDDRPSKSPFSSFAPAPLSSSSGLFGSFVSSGLNPSSQTSQTGFGSSSGFGLFGSGLGAKPSSQASQNGFGSSSRSD